MVLGPLQCGSAVRALLSLSLIVLMLIQSPRDHELDFNCIAQTSQWSKYL